MPTYVIRNGKLVEKTAEMAAEAPSVIRDEMEPLRNMADGRRYTSKAKFRQATRDAGCVEIGNENPVNPFVSLFYLICDRREDIQGPYTILGMDVATN
jgi:hypothetical protein